MTQVWGRSEASSRCQSAAKLSRIPQTRISRSTTSSQAFLPLHLGKVSQTKVDKGKRGGVCFTRGLDMLDEVGSSEQEEGGTGRQDPPEHLLLMVNGLFGSSANWLVVQRNLQSLCQTSKILMLASNANLQLQTFGGIDNCGKRLAKELQECTDANPSLTYISVIGHSMGGLIARYTIGILYDQETKSIAGLTPKHFISLATPHLGCGGEGPAQVPFIGWTEDVPFVGPLATKVMQSWADGFASTFLRRTGEQFFLLDGSPSSSPLLVKMVEDGPDGHFFSALRAFASRTCYANSSGDHIVGWANASVRHPDELPELGDLTDARGVVREDPLDAAIQPLLAKCDQTSRLRTASATEGSPSRLGGNGAHVPSPTSSASLEMEEAEETIQSSRSVVRILERLQTLPWCRIDASFKGTKFPYFAHNLIQVTREWLNWEGENVVQHLAQHFAKLEKAYSRQ